MSTGYIKQLGFSTLIVGLAYAVAVNNVDAATKSKKVQLAAMSTDNPSEDITGASLEEVPRNEKLDVSMKDDVRSDATRRTAKRNLRNTQTDVDAAQEIRSHLVNDDNLSIYAKNVSIVSVDGKVTLRGTVNSEEEKRMVERHARMVVAPANIRNQLRVAPTESAR